ncbi:MULTISPECIES: NAD(P)H-dependent oxidoreductase [Streptomyces]|uniref:NADPH-dependent FMN reductase n=1 Tax=Streptomyces venezuelae TaxID=54571 RepID=A0A5P2BEX1_STRVZ|nr:MULTISPECIES: NAD(P)H-dependent oxidoreductase [Streptomyces]NEA00128.1 NAD(P)H-dependent oxidoreductase [Streptomyces sp. SID10116]MYY84452.1 NADPH-dependent FMN reductase [Streptomyces sp. SID335]MYZ12276.1 NADPH-dependent FMN reductase [Streptomyces sp. SID337]NDZ86355.1 NAD(P)H-dependent oxidoreductase [Streptomyces sp. SID10115]NEB50288.1 NAD(P)H-dependent oxidoreductase [Streptomyces sp. SID339]
MTASTSRPAALRVAILVGSTREGRFAPVVTRWIKGHLDQREDMDVDVIDLAETPLPSVLPAFGAPPEPATAEALALVSPRLAAADAFVFITPEYNHSYPASLKNAIDWHNEQWHAKPIGFVSYGGLSGGLRAVEHLRVVMAELNAATIRNTVSLHNAWGSFDEEHGITEPASDAAVKTMLDQLAWWALALRDAKAVRPYAA